MTDTIRPYIFDNVVYTQVNKSLSEDPYYFFSIGATFSTPGSFNAATAVYPGSGSPQPLSLLDPARFDFGSQSFSSLAALHNQYSFGTYTVTATGSQPTSSSSLSYTADHFTYDKPFITNYVDLDGLDPSKDFTVKHNSFTPDPQTTGLEFFYIWDDAHHLVFKDEFDSASNTTSLIKAGTLAPGTHYTFELDFSDRLVFANGEEGFDVRTFGDFSTKPSTETFLKLDKWVFFDNPYVAKSDPATIPAGWDLKAKSTEIFSDAKAKADGFYAEAFSDAHGNWIISFSGSDFRDLLDGRLGQTETQKKFALTWSPPTPWAKGSQDADLQILKGVAPQAFEDAVQFTKYIIDIVGKHLDPEKVFLTGHSLGGAEAEYVASNYALVGTKLGGAVTFGAPGIIPGPENPNGGGSADSFNFTNIIDRGDPVGNYADHWGQNVYIDNNANSGNTATIDSIAAGLTSGPFSHSFPVFLGRVQVESLSHGIDAVAALKQHHLLDAHYDDMLI